MNSPFSNNPRGWDKMITLYNKYKIGFVKCTVTYAFRKNPVAGVLTSGHFYLSMSDNATNPPALADGSFG